MINELKAGMSYQVADGVNPHRSYTPTGVKAFHCLLMYSLPVLLENGLAVILPYDS